MAKFIFDLDGTVTAEETLPIIANHFNLAEMINDLTRETIGGNIPFVESFIQRVHILGKLSVNEIADLLENVRLYPKVVNFINHRQDDCVIATGNLGFWVERLASRIKCRCYTSDGEITDNGVKLTKILRKEQIVKKYQSQGEKVVFIGDGNNDLEAMRQADVAIATGLTHWPATSILPISDYVVFSEEGLCRLLNQLS